LVSLVVNAGGGRHGGFPTTHGGLPTTGTMVGGGAPQLATTIHPLIFNYFLNILIIFLFKKIKFLNAFILKKNQYFNFFGLKKI
jgi:hypothetical protein